ncbi:MAG: thiamine pyrophosphate-binding protein [Ardenticatenaceae bacterium]|nr:thiamine pyrophosphate-binding protein [Ardenticatenaceae bacterium]
MDEAATLLRRAERPVIYAGGGVISAGASSEVRALAETLRAPVVTTVQGRGSIPDDHPLSLGNAWGRTSPFTRLAQAADVVLAVGTRLSESSTDGWRLPLPANLIVVDVDTALPGRHYPVRVALAGDARAVLGQLLDAVDGFAAPDRRAFLAEVAVWREAEAARVTRIAPVAAQFLQTLRQALDRDAIVVNDMTMPSYWAQRYFPVYEPRTFLFPYYFGTLGFSMPAAIGARLAHPERQVVSICGDGGFLFTCQELATAVQLGLNLPVIVFNDHCFSGVKGAQDRALGGRHIGINLVNPDFMALGRAFGARSCRVEDVSQLAEPLADAFAADGPSLIEVPIGLPSPRVMAAAG